jgi:hypothetical protein
LALVLIPCLASLLVLVRWMKEGRDPARRAITVQYEPPEELSPAEVGTLVDHKAQTHDLTATLVDLAVRGYIHIEERAATTKDLGSETDYVFHLKKAQEEWGALKTHERRYLEGLSRYADVMATGRGLACPRHR